MDPNTWQPYTKRHSAGDKRNLRVTIWPSGRLGMNIHVWQALGSPTFVRLFYSESPRRIALVAVPEKVPGAVKVWTHSNHRGTSCSVKGFCSQFDIPLEQILTFEPDAPTPDRTLILDLTTAGQRKRRSLKKL